MLVLNKIKNTAHVVSFKAHKALENGEFVAIGKLDASAAYGVGEIFEAATPSATTKKAKVCLVAGVEMMADDSMTPHDFKIAKGDVVRGIQLEAGDVITIPVALIKNNSGLAVENTVVLGTDTKLEKKEATGAELVACEVLALPEISGVKSVQLLVL